MLMQVGLARTRAARRSGPLMSFCLTLSPLPASLKRGGHLAESRAVNISEVLNRRGDLSTFVVHLTRDRDSLTARQALESIIAEHRIRAFTPMGWAREQDDPDDPAARTQRVVCFGETPLEHVFSLVADIDGRSVNLKPYGVAFTKMAARQTGVNPVWYVDRTPGRDWVISQALNELKDRAIELGDFHRDPIARVLPFFEPMGTWPGNGTRMESGGNASGVTSGTCPCRVAMPA